MDKNKNRIVKKQVSIITIFLCITLIVVMSVIVVQGVVKSNNLENGETRTLTLKVDFTEALDLQMYEIAYYGQYYGQIGYDGIVQTMDENLKRLSCNIKYIGIENIDNKEVGIYEVEIPNESKYIVYYDYFNRYSVTNENREFEHFNISYNQSYSLERLNDNEDIYEVKLVEPIYDSISLSSNEVIVAVDFTEFFEVLKDVRCNRL